MQPTHTPQHRLQSLSERLGTLGPRGAMLLFAVVALVASALTLGNRGRGTREELFAGQAVSAEQMRKVREAFDAAGLKGYQLDKGRLFVPRDDLGRYLATLLQRKALPYQQFHDVLQKQSWLSTHADLERQWDLATKQYLSTVIGEMDGIDEAWVSWPLSAQRGLRGEPDLRASVVVRTEPTVRLTRAMIDAVRRLVVGQVAGLAEENVSVVDLRLGDDAVSGDPLQQVQRLEEHYHTKVAQLIRFVEGAIISVHVEPRAWFAAAREVKPVQIPDSQTPSSKAARPAQLDPALWENANAADHPASPRIDVTVAIPAGEAGADSEVQQEARQAELQRLVATALQSHAADVHVNVTTYSGRTAPPASPAASRALSRGHLGMVALASLLVGAVGTAVWRRASTARRKTPRAKVQVPATPPSEPSPTATPLSPNDLRQAAELDPQRTLAVLQNWIQSGNSA